LIYFISEIYFVTTTSLMSYNNLFITCFVIEIRNLPPHKVKPSVKKTSKIGLKLQFSFEFSQANYWKDYLLVIASWRHTYYETF